MRLPPAGPLSASELLAECEERAAIMEYDGGLRRGVAELHARRITEARHGEAAREALR